MELYFKNLNEKDKFKKFDGEVLDLNNTIFKVVCENNIKEVIFGDEKFNCNDKNELVFVKLRTSTSNMIELKVIECIKGKRDKVYKKIIKIADNSFVYNSMQLEKIKQLGELAYKNINTSLSSNNEDYYETIMTNLNDGLKSIDEVYKAIVNIIKLSTNIAKQPKVDLIQTEEIRESSQVKKISSNSARYFIMHPEDWFKEGDSLPKPIKLLTDSYEECKDIYENQLIKFILYKCIRIVDSKIVLLKARKSTLKASLVKYENDIENDNAYKEKSTEEYTNQKNEFRNTESMLSKFKSIYFELKKVYDDFSTITLNKKIKFKMTQKILYDKRYLRVVQLFKNHLKDKEELVNEVMEREYCIIYSYLFIIAESLYTALQSLGFYENEDIDNRDFFNDGEIIINGTHHNDENFKFKLEIKSLISEESLIKISLIYKEKVDTIAISINSLLTNKKVCEAQIEEIYNKYSINNTVDTNIIANLASLEDLDFSSEDEKKKSIFKLSNLGNNFISEVDYSKYGNFKMGMLPLGLNDLPNMFDKMINLFYLKFIKLGFYNYCKFCRSGEFKYVDDELLECTHCSQKIAIHSCKFCGEKNIKILAKKENLDFNYNNTQEDIIEIHKNYELGSHTLGACYEYYKSNSGGFCSSCGRCAKKSSNCLRCLLVDWEE